MKRAFVLFFFLITFSRLGYGQAVQPEFELQLQYSTADGGGNTDAKGFGYDPAATVGIDPQFGEEFYPGVAFPGDYFFAFNLNDSAGDYSEVDILPKPTTDTFTLQYSLYLSAYMYPATLSWNPSDIPPAIKGITITPFGAPFLKMVDMTKQASVTIDDVNPTDTNYANNWEPAIITIYYNTPSPFDGVTLNPVAGEGLLSNLIAYPNPMSNSGAVAFMLSGPASVIVTGYDAVGREVLRVTKNEPAGETMLDLTGLTNARGAIMLRVDAASDAQHDTKSVMLVKE